MSARDHRAAVMPIDLQMRGDAPWQPGVEVGDVDLILTENAHAVDSIGAREQLVHETGFVDTDGQ
jgi:hypothetical protein